MRVLAITKLFPNSVEPLAAPFNRQQFAALAKLCELTVMATIPWFPGAGFVKSSSAGQLVGVPARETIDGLDVLHPRTIFIPRRAMATWGPLYLASIAHRLLPLRGKIDVVLGAWAYPDGFAAIAAARLLGVPSVVKLHGSDINLIGQLPGAKQMIAWSLPKATRVVAVSRPLADEVARLGVPRDRIDIVMNGVDAELFHPRDRAAARRELGLPATGPIALFIGNFKEEKGITDFGAAWPAILAAVPAATIVVVGGGPLKAAVEQLAAPHGDRVRLVGQQPLPTIPTWLAAADLLVLPSRAEGTPNVVLEALASGRRVVGTRVGGVPDLLTHPDLGTLVEPRDPAALARAVATALQTPYDPSETASRGARGGWATSAARLRDVLASARGLL